MLFNKSKSLKIRFDFVRIVQPNPYLSIYENNLSFPSLKPILIKPGLHEFSITFKLLYCILILSTVAIHAIEPAAAPIQSISWFPH